MLTISVFFEILLITSLITSAQAATVHGNVYAWQDFEKPLKNVIVEVNSTPAQSKVATDGTYSFDLSQGHYVIKAKYYRNNVLEYAAEEEIQIDREGDFTIDLLLFPPTAPDYELPGNINLPTDIKDEDNLNNYIVLILILLLSTVVFLIFKKKKIKVSEIINKLYAMPPENIAETKITREIPKDLRDIYDLILKMGGRTTQKDMRKEMKCSEAKVSLMIADLEDRGLIKKIKKGRSNLIIALERIPKV